MLDEVSEMQAAPGQAPACCGPAFHGSRNRPIDVDVRVLVTNQNLKT